MTLKLGPLEVEPPVVLAPMAGVTNAAFRTLCRSYGAGLYVSEMVSARALVEGNLMTVKRLGFGADETVRSVQLYGVDPVVVGLAVSQVVDLGVDHIDLNMGCPSPKVTRHGGGAALPVRAGLLALIVRAAVEAAGTVPVTVKMRMGLDADTLTYLDAGRAAEAEGAAAVALHARTAEQLYSGRADWSAIGELKAAVTSIPVLGNGDIWDAHDAVEMMRLTGCDGVVVGRGCLGKPWLFRDLVDVFAGRAPRMPPLLGEVASVMLRHAALLVEAKGDELLGVRDFRKHVSWYLTGYPVGGVRRRALASASSMAELEELLAPLDPLTPLPSGAERLPRGHTQGPRLVTLPDGWRDSAGVLTPPVGADGVFASGG